MGGEPQTLQGIREAAEEAGAHLEHAPDLPRATRLLAAGAWDVVLAVLGERSEACRGQPLLRRQYHCNYFGVGIPL